MQYNNGYISFNNSPQITPKYISFANLKIKEIKSMFPAIGSASIYGDELVYSCGDGKLVVNSLGSANINHIVVYDLKTDKVNFLKELSKNWMVIDNVQMNNNWILCSAVLDTAGAKTTCYVIDRNTGMVKDLLENYKNFRADYFILQGDYAVLAIRELEGNLEKIIRVNLRTREEQKYFESNDKSIGLFPIWKLEGEKFTVGVDKVVSTKPYIEKRYLYLYTVSEKNPEIIQLPDYVENYIIPDENDEEIIYFKDDELVIAPLRNPGIFRKIGFKISKSIIPVGFASKDYIIIRLESIKNSDVLVYNRIKNDINIIKGLSIDPDGQNYYVEDFNDNFILGVHSQDNAPDSLFLINLEEIEKG